MRYFLGTHVGKTLRGGLRIVKGPRGANVSAEICMHARCQGLSRRCRNARALGLHAVVVLGRSLMGKFGEEGEARPPPDAELWEKNVGALAEAFEAVRPCVPHL